MEAARDRWGSVRLVVFSERLDRVEFHPPMHAPRHSPGGRKLHLS